MTGTTQEQDARRSGRCGRILYVASTLPARSETFVYRELFSLRKLGLSVLSASVHAPERSLGTTALDVLSETTYALYPLGVCAILRSAAKEIVTVPRASLCTSRTAGWDAVHGTDLGLIARLKTCWHWVMALALARWARAQAVTHIHAHMAHVPATIAMYAARQLRVPFSFTGHANDLFPNRTLLAEKIRRSVFVSCISHWHRHLYRRICPYKDLTQLPVIRCAVDTRRIHPRAAEQRGVTRVLAVGRLVRKKGFDVLVDAAVEVARRGRLRAEVLIIGSGPEERFLRKRARDAPSCVEIKFAGAANNDEVDRSMSEADIFVLPLRVTETGDRDGIPVVLMEAMAHALPVISGDLVAIRELIEDGENGLLIPCGSVASLVLAIESIGNDIELRRKLGCAARKTVESEFDLSANALRMYDALCGRRPPG